MKEDILEQLVDDYLQHKGYFTRHNIKFRPRLDHPDYIKNKDSSYSDIDVIGFNPLLSGPARVKAVSCKSWQNGLNPATEIAQIEKEKIVSGREAWKAFREITKPKWSEAFLKAVKDITGESEFTYVTAITTLKGKDNKETRETWEKNAAFRKALNNNPIEILTLSDILNNLFKDTKKTLASSHVGRMLQLIKASKWKPTQ
jgi:hypothetical protein